MPAMSSPRRSTSAVCTAARISVPRGRQRIPEVAGGAHAATRAVEGGQQPVAGEADQSAVVLLDTAAGGRGEVVEQAGQAGVADIGGRRDRGGNAGGQHGGEKAVGRRRHRRGASHKLRHRGQDRPGVAAEQKMICAGQLQEPGAGDAGGEVAGMLDPEGRVVPAVHDERWNADARQHRGDVDGTYQLDQPPGRPGGGGLAFEA